MQACSIRTRDTAEVAAPKAAAPTPDPSHAPRSTTGKAKCANVAPKTEQSYSDRSLDSKLDVHFPVDALPSLTDTAATMCRVRRS